MNINSKIKARGYFTISILRKGKVIPVCVRKPNLLLNPAFHPDGGFYLGGTPGTTFYAQSDGSPNHEDLDGTWSQSGNTITRVTGTGTFPSSPNQIGNELLWETGERCHVVTRVNDTTITVSGPPRTLTGLRLRRFRTSAWWSQNAAQTANGVADPAIIDVAAGTYSQTVRVTFNSATTPYTLRRMATSRANTVLEQEVAIEIDDQVQVDYTFVYSVTNRVQNYELGAESEGIPQKHSMLTIVGDGTNVDVAFSAATHFLAGDKLDLRSVVPKRFAIASASSDATTLTLVTAEAHGLSIADAVVVENAAVAGYNGSFSVATVPDSTTITITNAGNPGAMGASGTVRLATPAGYFDSLGLATIASMTSSSVARITSAVTGPAADPVPIGGDPGVNQTFYAGPGNLMMGGNLGNTYMGITPEASEKAIPPVGQTTSVSTAGSVSTANKVRVNATPSNDFTATFEGTWNAGTGTGMPRVKQVLAQGSSGYMLTVSHGVLFTFNTPFEKKEAERFRFAVSMQSFQELSPSTFD